jgi:hypothetical protein
MQSDFSRPGRTCREMVEEYRECTTNLIFILHCIKVERDQCFFLVYVSKWRFWMGVYIQFKV